MYTRQHKIRHSIAELLKNEWYRFIDSLEIIRASTLSSHITYSIYTHITDKNQSFKFLSNTVLSNTLYD